MTKEIETVIACPDCGQTAALDICRKRGTVMLDCPDCEQHEETIIPYGESVVIEP